MGATQGPAQADYRQNSVQQEARAHGASREGQPALCCVPGASQGQMAQYQNWYGEYERQCMLQGRQPLPYLQPSAIATAAGVPLDQAYPAMSGMQQMPGMGMMGSMGMQPMNTMGGMNGMGTMGGMNTMVNMNTMGGLNTMGSMQPMGGNINTMGGGMNGMGGMGGMGNMANMGGMSMNTMGGGMGSMGNMGSGMMPMPGMGGAGGGGYGQGMGTGMGHHAGSTGGKRNSQGWGYDTSSNVALAQQFVAPEYRRTGPQYKQAQPDFPQIDNSWAQDLGAYDVNNDLGQDEDDDFLGGCTVCVNSNSNVQPIFELGKPDQ